MEYWKQTRALWITHPAARMCISMNGLESSSTSRASSKIARIKDRIPVDHAFARAIFSTNAVQTEMPIFLNTSLFLVT